MAIGDRRSKDKQPVTEQDLRRHPGCSAIIDIYAFVMGFDK
jgi:hypothetical protein